MSFQITTAFVQQFQDTYVLLAQQKGSRLRGRLLEKQVTGDAAYFERIGPTAALRRTSRHADTPQVDTPHSRRRVDLSDWDWADLVDKADEPKMLIDPASAYAQNAAFAMGRAMDDVIIAAATGTSISVSSSLTASTSNVSFASGNIVAYDFKIGSSNLTIEKLREARRILMHNNIDMAEEMTVVVNASALDALLGTTQVTSADFNTVKALVSGTLDTFLGFKFVQTERLLGTADGTSTAPIQCIAFARSALGLAISRDITTRISERDDKCYSLQIYASMGLGATRIEEEKIVQMNCVQSS